MHSVMPRRALLLLAAITVVTSNLSCTGQLVGGPCTYADFTGKATITDLRSHEEGANEVGYWVTFDTELTGKDSIPSFYQHQDRRVLIKNPDGNTDIEWLAAQGVSVDAKLDIQAALITSGTCTPVIFKFPTLPAGALQD